MERTTIRYLGKYRTVKKEVADTIRMSRRKMRYQTRDIKYERIRIDMEREIVNVIPGREDSLDRLLDEKQAEFATDDERIDDIIEKELMCAMLPALIARLSPSEREMLHMLFWDQKTERAIAAELQIAQQNVNKRKEKILGKLLKMLEK